MATATPSGCAVTGYSAFQNGFYAYMRGGQACAACHTTIQYPHYTSSNPMVAYVDALPFLNKQSPGLSSFVPRAGDNHGGIGAIINPTTTLVTHLTNWAAAETCVASSNAPIPEPTSTPAPTATPVTQICKSAHLISFANKVWGASNGNAGTGMDAQCKTCHQTSPAYTRFDLRGMNYDQCLAAVAKINRANPNATLFLDPPVDRGCRSIPSSTRDLWKTWIDETLLLN